MELGRGDVENRSFRPERDRPSFLARVSYSPGVEKGYFYTPDGTETLGPVDAQTLYRLAREGVLHAGSSICRVGESEWKRFDPAAFSKPPLPPIPKSAPSRVVRAPARQQTVVVEDDAEAEKGFIPSLLNVVAVIAAIRSLLLYFFFPPRLVQPTDIHVRTWTELAIGVVVLIALPWWFSMLFKGLIRTGVRTAGIVFLSILMGLEIFLFEPKTPDGRVVADLPERIGNPGDDSQPDTEAPGNNTVPDGAAVTRANHVTESVKKAFDAKVKIGQDALAACNLDVTTITGADDIAQRRVKLEKYRQTQVDLAGDAKTLRSRLREAMVQEKVPADLINQIVSSPASAHRYDLMISLWQNRVKVVDDQIAHLDFLNQTYGTWNVANGQIIFHDQASLDSYNALTQTIQNDAKAANDTAKQVLQ
jgi:hypothetical protein